MFPQPRGCKPFNLTLLAAWVALAGWFIPPTHAAYTFGERKVEASILPLDSAGRDARSEPSASDFHSDSGIRDSEFFSKHEANTGRFLSPDPAGHGGSLDLYSYANGDPVNFCDPDGRFAKGSINAFQNGYGLGAPSIMMGASYALNNLGRDSGNGNFAYISGFSSSWLESSANMMSPQVTIPQAYQANYAYHGTHGGALNATFNPAYMAISGGYEAWTGLGISSYNSGSTLTGVERFESGLQSFNGAVGTVGLGFGGLNLVRSANTAVHSMIDDSFNVRFGVEGNPALKFNAPQTTPSVIYVTPNGVAISSHTLALQGSSAHIRNFTGLNGATVNEIVSRIPANWTSAPQKFGQGLVWFDEMGGEALRIHGSSVKAPVGSNSSSGWTLRLHAPGGQFFDDMGNVVGPKTNEGHIPIFGNPNAHKK